MEKEILNKVETLLKMYKEGVLGGEVMPEDVLIDVVPSDKLINVLTLPMSLNYQRNSYKLWESVVSTYLDKNTNWIFDISRVVDCELEDLREALFTHKVGLQPNKHPEIWKRVATGFKNSTKSGEVIDLLESLSFDIALLKDIMQNKRKKEFPYLSGPKIFNYWLYVLESYTDISWKSRDLITIAPDTHILQSSVKLGLCGPDVLQGRAEDRNLVSKLWEEALNGTSVAPIDIHTPLWLWSRSDFKELI